MLRLYAMYGSSKGVTAAMGIGFTAVVIAEIIIIVLSTKAQIGAHAVVLRLPSINLPHCASYRTRECRPALNDVNGHLRFDRYLAPLIRILDPVSRVRDFPFRTGHGQSSSFGSGARASYHKYGRVACDEGA